jgi:predicted nucleic acid-binding protein
MLQAVFLDSGPLGLVTKRPGKSKEVDDCLQWITDLVYAGCRVVVSEVSDFEVRRELIRAGQSAGIARLDAFNTARADRYLPITTQAMRLAAELWAKTRNMGVPTADARALDADVILAAQALSAGLPHVEIVVASVNVRHISRIVPSEEWRNIVP